VCVCAFQASMADTMTFPNYKDFCEVLALLINNSNREQAKMKAAKTQNPNENLGQTAGDS
jgi:hypothetical protein